MKKAIIIGDSYSTYKGYLPEGFRTHYPTADVDDVEKTWWARLGKQADIEWIQNNSWSGSPLGFTGYNNMNCSGFGSFIARYRELKSNGFFEQNKIDTVFVFGGTNDSWAGAPLGEVMLSDWVDDDLFKVLPAICYLTCMLKSDLPDAEIILIINTGIKPEIQDCFEVAAKHFGVKSVRLQDIDKVSNHPTAKGMQAICDQVAAVLKLGKRVMLKENIKSRVNAICNDVIDHIENKNICCFSDREKPLFLISETYPGVWMEHIYDSVFYARLDPTKRELPKTTLLAFIELQREDGHLPFAVFDPARNMGRSSGYSQIQECVSFATLCLETYEITGDRDFLKAAYESSKKWVAWLENNRMTRGGGLIEMFVGFDTGHDHSARLDGLSCKGNYRLPGNSVAEDASVLPPDDDVAPVFAVDMNCNFYGNLKSIAKMAVILESGEAEEYERKAAEVKRRLIEICYDEQDAFFYDVDKHGNKRKYLSSTIFHLFLEKVLNFEEDGEMIERIYREHIKNPREFWTEYPFPSMAVSDPSLKSDAKGNCWGYFSQGLIALRCTRWMDDYGWGEDFDHLCERWVEAWTRCYDRFKFGQELDPFTGEPSECSEWYSSCMLFYIYAVRRLGL